MFDLSTAVPGAHLLHDSELGRFRLASDTIATGHSRKLAHLYDRMPARSITAFHALAYTIGGMLVFPGNRIDGKQTINQHRGTHHRIQDRIDLTLECIRLHYSGEPSPLGETLALFGDFFALFGDFAGYTRFFVLHDLVDDDGCVRFLRPHTGFDEPALPSTLDEYAAYRTQIMTVVRARNRRIAGRGGAAPQSRWRGLLRRSI